MVVEYKGSIQLEGDGDLESLLSELKEVLGKLDTSLSTFSEKLGGLVEGLDKLFNNVSKNFSKVISKGINEAKAKASQFMKENVKKLTSKSVSGGEASFVIEEPEVSIDKLLAPTGYEKKPGKPPELPKKWYEGIPIIRDIHNFLSSFIIMDRSWMRFLYRVGPMLFYIPVQAKTLLFISSVITMGILILKTIFAEFSKFVSAVMNLLIRPIAYILTPLFYSIAMTLLPFLKVFHSFFAQMMIGTMKKLREVLKNSNGDLFSMFMATTGYLIDLLFKPLLAVVLIGINILSKFLVSLGFGLVRYIVRAIFTVASYWWDGFKELGDKVSYLLDVENWTSQKFIDIFTSHALFNLQNLSFIDLFRPYFSNITESLPNLSQVSDELNKLAAVNPNAALDTLKQVHSLLMAPLNTTSIEEFNNKLNEINNILPGVNENLMEMVNKSNETKESTGGLNTAYGKLKLTMDLFRLGLIPLGLGFINTSSLVQDLTSKTNKFGNTVEDVGKTIGHTVDYIKKKLAELGKRHVSNENIKKMENIFSQYSRTLARERALVMLRIENNDPYAGQFTHISTNGGYQ